MTIRAARYRTPAVDTPADLAVMLREFVVGA